MSETLRVTIEGHHLSLEEEQALRDLYSASAKTVIPSATVPSIRLVFRHEPHGTTIEPFVGSAALEALLRVRKKRDDALALLALLIACALWVSDRVGILLAAEGLAVPRERADLSFATLLHQPKIKPGWYRIAASPSWFHFAQVEAKLLQPLKFSDEKPATHYFRELWVRAVERQVACGVVTCSVEEDAAVVANFGEVRPDEPPSTGERGNLVARGRIYFSERAD